MCEYACRDEGIEAGDMQQRLRELAGELWRSAKRGRVKHSLEYRDSFERGASGDLIL